MQLSIDTSTGSVTKKIDKYQIKTGFFFCKSLKFTLPLFNYEKEFVANP